MTDRNIPKLRRRMILAWIGLAVGVAGFAMAATSGATLFEAVDAASLQPVDWTPERVAATEPEVVAVATATVDELVARSVAYRDGLVGASAGGFVAMPAGARTSYATADATVVTRSCDLSTTRFRNGNDQQAVLGPCAAIRFDDTNGRAFVVYLVFDGTGWVRSNAYSLHNPVGSGPTAIGVDAVWPASEVTAAPISSAGAEILTPDQRQAVDGLSWLALACHGAAVVALVGAIACGFAANRAHRSIEAIQDRQIG